MRIENFRRSCVALISLSLLSLGIQLPAAAGIIGTADALATMQEPGDLQRVHATLARAEVREQLLALGVDPAEVEGRLSALSGAELAALAANMDLAPAGGSALAVIGVVFLVLLLLEYTGTIDIFKKVP